MSLNAYGVYKSSAQMKKDGRSALLLMRMISNAALQRRERDLEDLTTISRPTSGDSQATLATTSIKFGGQSFDTARESTPEKLEPATTSNKAKVALPTTPKKAKHLLQGSAITKSVSPKMKEYQQKLKKKKMITAAKAFLS